MGLPKQVVRQSEEISRLEESLKPKQAEVQEVKATAPEVEAKQPEQAESRPEPQVEQKQPEPPQQQGEDEAKWEHKYKSLANHYTRFAKDQNAKIAELEFALEELRKAPKQEAKPEVKEDAKPLVTEDDVEQFGSDLVNLARRIARDEFGSREKDYRSEIQELKQALNEAKAQLGDVAKTQTVSAKERFFSNLEARVPDWEQLQNTEACQEWLGTRVAGTRYTWHDVLVDAATQHDVGRAVEVFQAFKATQPQQQKPVNQAELQRQVAPQKSKNSQAPNANKKVYTVADITSASQQIIKLQKAGKFEDAARLENDLNAAYAEGRIRA